MLIATSAVSLVLVALNSRGTRMMSPAKVVPASFAASGVLFLIEWWLTSTSASGGRGARVLHISGAGPVLGSGFWLIVSERFDPRTAKRSLGRIAGAGTAGGLLSAILAERVAALGGAAAMLPFLAVFHLVSAWQIHLLAIDSDSGTGAKATSLAQRAPATPDAERSRGHNTYCFQAACTDAKTGCPIDRSALRNHALRKLGHFYWKLSRSRIQNYLAYARICGQSSRFAIDHHNFSARRLCFQRTDHRSSDLPRATDDQDAKYHFGAPVLTIVSGTFQGSDSHPAHHPRFVFVRVAKLAGTGGVWQIVS